MTKILIQISNFHRAHQNTLEGYSQFLLLLLFGGLDMPIFVAIGGLIWVAGKVSYSKGYYTGDPKNRYTLLSHTKIISSQ